LKQGVLSPKATTFVNAVLAKKPSIAVFDCDGTLWSGDAGADFFYWEIERGLISPDTVERILPRYDDYKAGRVDELTMCGEMVTIHEGISLQRIRGAAAEFFRSVVEPRIFSDLRELTRRLGEQGCELWAVSSTNDWVINEGVKQFGIPPEHVLAASVAMNDGIATAELIRVPTDELKATAIEEVIGRPVDAVFGNSIHDYAMLELARDAYAVNPNADLETRARELGWTVYWPEKVLQ